MIETVSETAAAKSVTVGDAIALMEAMFASLDQGRSRLFPFISGQGSDQGTRFGVKLGYDGARGLPGLKVGSYWPGNVAKGIGAHASTTLLLDDDTGLPKALVAATHLTALRTAASDAVAVKRLARPQATVLVLVGTGRQAYWEALAVAQVRSLTEVLVCGRNLEAAEALAARLRTAGLPAASCQLARALAQADIICTATAARGPLFSAKDVRPGVHISAMGADGHGKQELDPDLAARASLWADLPGQSVVIGEFQYLAAAGLERIQPIGAAVTGRLPGRRSAGEITIYDSSGIALQDLAIAAFALEQARAAGLTIPLDLS